MNISNEWQKNEWIPCAVIVVTVLLLQTQTLLLWPTRHTGNSNLRNTSPHDVSSSLPASVPLNNNQTLDDYFIKPLCHQVLEDPNLVRVGEAHWDRFSQQHGSQKNRFHHNDDSPTVLVAQSSALSPGLYATMLDITSTVNRAYAQRHHYDYMTFRGIYYGCQEWHSAYNKLGILELAKKRGYKFVLLMDADALVYDTETSLDFLMSQQQNENSSFLIVAQDGYDETSQPKELSNICWNINNGVMFWNLGHPMSDKILNTWKLYSLWRLQASADGTDPFHDGDQQKLHNVLMNSTACQELVRKIPDIFNCREGTFVRHYKRLNFDYHFSWDLNHTAMERVEELRRVRNEVCLRMSESWLCLG